MRDLLEWMEYIEDPRQQSKVRHRLKDVLVIVLFATLANADDWVEIELFAKMHQAYLRNYITLFFGAGADQAVTFSGGFEQLVVVSTTTGTVLHIENRIAIHMRHFMEQRCNSVLNISVQRPGSDVDLVLHLIAVDGPNGRDRTVSVRSRG